MFERRSCLIEEPNAADAANPLGSAPVAWQHPIAVGRRMQVTLKLKLGRRLVGALFIHTGPQLPRNVLTPLAKGRKTYNAIQPVCQSPFLACLLLGPVEWTCLTCTPPEPHPWRTLISSQRVCSVRGVSNQYSTDCSVVLLRMVLFARKW